MSTYTERHKEYRKKNREKVNSYQKKYYAANRAKCLAYNKEYAEKHRIPKTKKIKSIVEKRICRLISGARMRAKRYNQEFNIELDDLVIPTHCPLLGHPLSLIQKELAYSLDRIDNTKGYIKENVWIISYRANRMKNSATLEEWKEFSESSLKKLAELI